MDSLLSVFLKKYEAYLNADQELQRRLKGFKTFAGLPDGHYTRARLQGDRAQARAIRCYPFGGSSLLADCDVIGVTVKDESAETGFVVSLNNTTFSVKAGTAENPHLGLVLSKELFTRTILGRYRWMWVIGMDEVTVTYSTGLPHSDWVTILEILVAMQELIEFDPDLLEKIEQY
jgi:hypothetical protein